MNRFLIAGAMGLLVFGAARAQQPTTDQVQDLSIQLNLTQQQLTEANKNFVNERSSTIRLGRQLNEALADNVKIKAEFDKKDGQIKELTDKAAGVDAATKVASAECDKKLQEAVKPPVCVAPAAGTLSSPTNPAPPTNAGPARP